MNQDNLDMADILYTEPCHLTRQTHMHCGFCNTVASSYGLKNCTKCGQANWCFGAFRDIIFEDSEKMASYLSHFGFDKDMTLKTAKILFENGFVSKSKLSVLSFGKLKEIGIDTEIAKAISLIE